MEKNLGKSAPAKTKAATKNKAKTAAKTVRKAAGAAQAEATTTTRQATREMEKQMTQGKAQFEKIALEAGNAGKEQVDALLKSGNIWMKGYEDLMKTCMGWAQSSAEKNAQAVKSMLSCRTLNELTETQNKVAQQNFDEFMKNATKFSELSVKITTEAFEPINDQLTRSMKKASDSLAA